MYVVEFKYRGSEVHILGWSPEEAAETFKKYCGGDYDASQLELMCIRHPVKYEEEDFNEYFPSKVKWFD